MKKKQFSAGYLAGFISVHVWGALKGSFHIAISSALASWSQLKWSRFFIGPYCWFEYGNFYHYRKFKPGSGGERFQSFQDFFTRDMELPLQPLTPVAWPCEGLLCESGPVNQMGPVKIKGDHRDINIIFGKEQNPLPKNYHYTNVYLHNNNYHHIHAPVDGTIHHFERIPGKLLFLRPWAYKNPSIPALSNERVNVDIKDNKGRLWYLSIVGGPMVATIKLGELFKIGSPVKVGQKIASFQMGSTCCMASPEPPQTPLGKNVDVGAPY